MTFSARRLDPKCHKKKAALSFVDPGEISGKKKNNNNNLQKDKKYPL